MGKRYVSTFDKLMYTLYFSFYWYATRHTFGGTLLTTVCAFYQLKQYLDFILSAFHISSQNISRLYIIDLNILPKCLSLRMSLVC